MVASFIGENYIGNALVALYPAGMSWISGVHVNSTAFCTSSATTLDGWIRTRFIAYHDHRSQQHRVMNVPISLNVSIMSSLV